MLSQHEEMVADCGALLEVVQEDLTPGSMEAMELLLERLAWNLDLAAGAVQAGQATSFSG